MPRLSPSYAQPFRTRWDHFQRSADAYGVVLLLLLATLLIPLVTGNDDALDMVLTTIVAGASVTLSMLASRAPAWLVVLAVVTWAVGVFIAIWPGEQRLTLSVAAILTGFLFVAAPVAILNRVARHRRITMRTVYGTLCVYLQVGLAYSLFFQTMDRLDDDAFSNAVNDDRVAFLYFSFVTLTTLGYGDITPVSDAARMTAVFETVIGQVFLVVVVARVVGLLGRARPSPSGSDVADDEDESTRHHVFPPHDDQEMAPAPET